MAISLGTRVSALLVAGAVAIVTAAVYEGRGDTGAPPRGGSDTSVSGGGRGGAAEVEERGVGSPTPAASALGSTETGRSVTSGPTGASSPDGPDGPAGRAGDAGPVPGTTAPHPVTALPWLPPGPVSPDADHRPDPASVYDLLREPEACADALRVIPRPAVGDDWRVLRGLAHACLAVQGRGGSWKVAERDHAALAGTVNTCKGGAAQRVLAGLIAFHRARPSGTARLTSAPAGAAPACSYGVHSVDVGEDGEARPGETIHVELRGTYFDHTELLREGAVLIGGRPVAGPALAVPGTGAGAGTERGDGLVLAVVVPALDAGYPRSVDVVVRYAVVEVVKEAAFRVVGPGVGGPTASPGPGSSNPPGSPNGPGSQAFPPGAPGPPGSPGLVAR
ncbi:hypothetical protein ABZ614_38795 [Streptomyces sp. NPDC013178]|uniref:hypothetical protein n=1 Tax=unclassified Streptomyces TaxID=2593676 RepID=UPI0033DF5C6E